MNRKTKRIFAMKENFKMNLIESKKVKNWDDFPE